VGKNRSDNMPVPYNYGIDRGTKDHTSITYNTVSPSYGAVDINCRCFIIYTGIKENKKIERRNFMKTFLKVVLALIILSLLVALVYVIRLSGWYVGVRMAAVIVAVIVAVIIGMYLDGLFDKEDEVYDDPKFPEPLPDGVLKELQELETYRKKEAEEKAAEELKQQKKRNKELIKQYNIIHSSDGSSGFILEIPNARYVIKDMKSVGREDYTYSSNHNFTNYDFTNYNITIEEGFTSREDEYVKLLFKNNKELRDLVWDKLFPPKANQDGES
jgi:hypothetical protein